MYRLNYYICCPTIADDAPSASVDLFIFLVGPLWETVSTAMIDAFIAPMGEIEKLLGRTQTAVQTARDDHAKSKNLRRLMASRRRLMGMGQFSALEAEDFTGEEMDQLLDDIVAHAVTTAAVRNGADVRDDGNSGRRRQLMEGVESDDGVLGDVHRVIESMFEWTHNSVIAGAYERMPALLSQPPPSARRGLLEGGGPNGESMGLGAGGLDWSNLMAFKEFEIVESVSPATSDHVRCCLLPWHIMTNGEARYRVDGTISRSTLKPVI